VHITCVRNVGLTHLLPRTPVGIGGEPRREHFGASADRTRGLRRWTPTTMDDPVRNERKTSGSGSIRVVRTLTRPAKRWLLDALLYGLSAAFAAVAASAADIPLQRTWATTAVWGYVGGTAVAVGGAVRFRRDGRDARPRAALAVVVFALTAMLPLVIAARLRAQGDPGGHAQSEVIIVEEGADAFLDARDPYAED
jgi:hypothetical protein